MCDYIPKSLDINYINTLGSMVNNIHGSWSFHKY